MALVQSPAEEGGKSQLREGGEIKASSPAPRPKMVGWVLPSAHAQILGGGEGRERWQWGPG